ncbi:hypothetical protein BK649_04075 [Pseudomonas canadensis]|uniref:Uncharacterized protein n=1 Tax=Pseudomonas canadensis TaxID=915099 RepID=A0A423FF21_9PSED|nr:hypothetical protein [Pseudomonas canadensis]ROM56146.1 hypothetical protein BK649_04075 [Pseudomonas canadensis]
MAKEKAAPETTSDSVEVTTSKPVKPNVLEVAAPLISSKVDGTITPPRIPGSTMKVDARMDAGDITFTFETKEKPGPQFEPIIDSSGESGARQTAIPQNYLTLAMGFTLLVSYKGTSQGKPAESLVEEAGVSFYSADESEALAPRLHHRKIVHNTPTYDMKDHEGDEQVNVPVPYLAKAGDKLYCTIATEQDAARHVFYHLVTGYTLTEEDASGGRVLHFFIRRGWLVRRKAWRVLTIQTGWITSGLPADGPADVPAHLETQLPANALEIQYRDSVALIVDPGIDKLPPHLRQSVLYNREWHLNPALTKNGGEVDVPNLDTYAGDHVCFTLSGAGHDAKPLGCVTIANDGDMATVELSACDIACFFNKKMTLSYTLEFPNGEEPQTSPEQVVTVSAPEFPHSGIEQATGTVLDLRTFAGDATALVPVWDYAECSKCCWMWITGEYEGGAAYRFDVLVGAPVTDEWKESGVDAPILRADLKKLADCSEFKLHFAVSFCEAIGLENAHEFPAQTFKIEQEPLVLTPPKVTEAVGTDLTAYNGRHGVHVEVDYVGNQSKHSISVCWKRPNGTCWPLVSKPGSSSGAVIFALPAEAVIESMGTTVEIVYTVTTACKVQTSPPLNLTISLPVRLETPNALEAVPARTQNGVLDLRTFTGNAHSLEDTMWFLRAGHICWLDATGTKKDGTPYSFPVYAARVITAGELTAGVAGPLLRSELDKLGDATHLTFVFRVATDGSANKSNAVVCPSRVLIVRVITMVTETFENLAGGYYPVGTILNTPLMTVSHSSATLGVHGAFSSEPGMTSGNAIAFSCYVGEGHLPPQQVVFALKAGYQRIELAYMRHVYYGRFEYFSASGDKLGERVLSAGFPMNSWIDFSAPSGQLITKIVVTTEQHSYTDNWRLYS